ncbi:hypothetical protein SAICODRAFT_9569 [Saitoella complicata NRRL Y-17804]|uniref:Uncharacterized protein n=1 Tax=Saitoella complicata (strain BCRC 22490 / CBS 7301 / JCM 7358 / NBRC 10748 / NRRL Y-17804) TaxID=698492 RepID=A0A0E9NFG4_SAICN|nr:uncharacterized protein SAICODRAFT_9569 [Saitoella complicata NRRL Y-17804]ODQ50928.1 hypothetical protein SAICODRAFT_9569 [Saitoella complicata NRRL Y-17804]GAO48426.1 hypothetical protein G7K_2599-t1 [Saitoella complicata NRRL Y-17804]
MSKRQERDVVIVHTLLAKLSAPGALVLASMTEVLAIDASAWQCEHNNNISLLSLGHVVPAQVEETEDKESDEAEYFDIEDGTWTGFADEAEDAEDLAVFRRRTRGRQSTLSVSPNGRVVAFIPTDDDDEEVETEEESGSHRKNSLAQKPQKLLESKEPQAEYVH